MKKIVLLLLLASPFTLWSQSIDLQGVILDSLTNAPIPYAIVSVKNKGIGVATGTDGVFDLHIQEYGKNDSLEFASLGYLSYRVSLPDYLERTARQTAVEVKLTPVSFELTEIVVFPAEEEVTFGILANRTPGAAYSYLPGAQVALFIPNDNGGEGIIKSISYFFTDKRRKPTAPFRIRLLAADENGRPGEDLLLESVVVSAPQRDAWFTVNLEAYHLPLPENGYFAGLELIYTEKKYQFKTKRPVRHRKMWFQGPSLGICPAGIVSSTWIGRIGWGWRRYSYVNKAGHSYDYMIRSTVKYRE